MIRLPIQLDYREKMGCLCPLGYSNLWSLLCFDVVGLSLSGQLLLLVLRKYPLCRLNVLMKACMEHAFQYLSALVFWFYI